MTKWTCSDRIIRAPWCRLGAWLVVAPMLAAGQDIALLSRAYRADPTAQNRAAVVQFAQTHQTNQGALALLSLGVKEIELKQFADALPHLESAMKRLPAIADYPAYFSAVADSELADYSRVEGRLSGVWDRSPASPLTGRSVVLLAKVYLKTNQPQKATALVNRYRGSLSGPAIEWLLAQAGDTASYAKLLTEYPLSKEANEADADDRLKSLPPKARLMRAIKLLDGGDAKRADTELEALLPSLSGADLELARLKLGVAKYTAHSFAAANSALASLTVANPEADAERLYYLIRSARRLDKPENFKLNLDRLASAHPKSTWRMQALLAAGDFYFLHNDVTTYETLYRTCAEAFSSDPQAAECQWRAAWGAHLKHRPESSELFKGLLTRFPASDKVPNGMYFLARNAEARGDWGSARAFYDEINSSYPNFFYATLARDRLKEAAIAKATPSPVAIAFLKTVAFPPRTKPENFSASPASLARYERARLLASGGLDELAENELRFGARTEGQREVVAVELAELATLREAPDMGIRYIKLLTPNYLRIPMDAAPERFWKLAFPLPFWTPLEQFSKERGLDPFLVAALIRQESEFNPKVISPAQAYGLTQVLPSTGREIGRKLNLKGFRADMLFQPEINLQIGTYIMRRYLDNAAGKWEAALASYNAGPGRVVQWLKWADFREPAEFVETIPFDETRNYVQSVLRNRDLYRRLYTGKEPQNPKVVASTNGDNGRKNVSPASGDRRPAPAVP